MNDDITHPGRACGATEAQEYFDDDVADPTQPASSPQPTPTFTPGGWIDAGVLAIGLLDAHLAGLQPLDPEGFALCQEVAFTGRPDASQWHRLKALFCRLPREADR